MQRRWQVHPDEWLQTPNGEIATVSRAAFVEAALDAVAMVDRGGGGASFVAGRAPTGVEGEMVTTGVMFEYVSRTVNASKEREQEVEVLPEVQSFEEPDAPEDDPERPGDDIGDGLDPSTLAEEDESAVEPVR